MNRPRQRPPVMLQTLLCVLLAALAVPGRAPVALASHTSPPASVNLVGSLESEATADACGDWDPGCVGAKFSPQPNGVYLFKSASIPAEAYQYKVAMGSWAENYGANFQHDGPNIDLNLASTRVVRFFYDHKTHYIADNVRNTIYTIPGSFNSELGCDENWQPECLATFMSDVDGDSVFKFTTDDIPAGDYEFKVATNESWSNPNYGANGGDANIPFSVAGPSTVTFSFDTDGNIPSVSVQSALPSPDNNVEWDGLRHDSRNLLYRTPGGAVPAGTPVTLRFRTFHNDVTGVNVRLYDLNANGQRFEPMKLAASDVSCYQDGLDGKTCDFWQATLPNAEPNNFWYRFVVTDGSDTDYYGDNTTALDGGLGAVTDEPVDQSYALMVYDPAFSAPKWAKDAVIYQIFPDRFRNGSTANDPQTGDVRYDDPVLKLPWNTLPEGYCRNYADGSTNCPWRFDGTPPDSSPTKEGPRGRDYMGGDLKGVEQQLDYLKSLGVNAIYFNPIFDAGSNHGYDTQSYYQIDPYFGTQKDWEALVKRADKLGIRIILDGVFNHMSSDSPFFDRYHHYPTVGACESNTSVYRSWFVFEDVVPGQGTCVDSQGRANAATYTGWFGFDSIPEINKSNPEVQEYFLTGKNNVSRYWLKRGAAAWRLDVMGDASFPNGYWEQFRTTVKKTDRDALIIGELWQKDSTLLRYLRGDRSDTTMNYRLRDAVIGLLTPGAFDSKGFGDSGRQLAPSEFAARIASIHEDYPDAAFFSLMNLLDSHDTERLLWTLTPGAETRAEKEFNATNLADGKARQRLASLIQFTMPGAPTVYYGDEVGMTGDDDPDDRRTYPWADLGGVPDTGMFNHYAQLSKARRDNEVLTAGDLRVLLADDTADTVAYGRATNKQAAIVVINRGSQARTVEIPVAGYVPNGTALKALYGGSGTATVSGGVLRVTLNATSGLLLMSDKIDRTAPSAPKNLRVMAEGNGTVNIAWDSVGGVAGYNVYRSPVSGGGWVKLNNTPLTATTFADSGLRNASAYFYTVTALDKPGNESVRSNEVSAMPRYAIGWANTQWPPSINHTVSVTNRTPDVYGQVYIDGVTGQQGATPGLKAQFGFGPNGSAPANNMAWTWVDATFNTDAGNNDEFKANLLPEQVGSFDYAYRYSTTDGREWIYADLDGIGNGYSPEQAGELTVVSSGDTTAPATPANVRVVSASPAGIELAWNAVDGDASLYGYEVLRGDEAGGPYTQLARVTGNGYTDTAVAQGASYVYVVRSIDQSFNRSANSTEVEATAELRTVTLQFTLTVPASTDASGREPHIAGFLDRLDGNLPQWDPGGVKLTRVNATTWSLTLTGKESTQIEYKYALGSWDYVEKDGVCGELGNRQLTLSYGANGVQQVNDTVANWRNVSPCGN